MIRITKKECPSELTDDVRKKLTQEYKENPKKAVWKKPYILEKTHTANVAIVNAGLAKRKNIWASHGGKRG